MTEIACPQDCVHLVTAREHPAAVVRRQQERDVATLLPSIRHLNERQQQLFFLFHSAVAGHVPDGFARLVDADVAEAAAAVAATLETAARGVIFEHVPQSLPAQKLARELTALLEQMRQHTRIYDGEVAITLRAMETGARDAGRTTPSSAGTSYIEIMRRLLRQHAGSAAAEAAPAAQDQASSLILPPT